MGQSGQDPRRGGLECDGLTLKVYAIDSLGAQGLEHCTKEEHGTKTNASCNKHHICTQCWASS